MADAHPGCRVGHAPPVAVEHRQGVQEHIPVGDGRVPPEDDRVEPAVAVGQLHPLGAGCRARGVVDAAGGGLVRLPPARAGGIVAQLGEELAVLHTVEDDALFDAHVGERLVQFGIHQQHRRSRVVDDVADLLGVQPEVDGHEHAPEPADAEVRDQEAPRVGAHDGHPLPGGDSHVVEGSGHSPGPAVELGIGQPVERARHRRLVDQCNAIGVGGAPPLEEVADGKRYLHDAPLVVVRREPTYPRARQPAPPRPAAEAGSRPRLGSGVLSMARSGQSRRWAPSS